MAEHVQLFRELDGLPDNVRGGAVSIGNFDGVHRGHARLVEQLRALARRVGGPSLVFTFDPHPVRLLRPEAAPPPLTWTDRKAALLAELGVDAIIAYPTDESLLQLSPRAFFDRIVREQLAARAMVEGPNFRFGHGREGNVAALRHFCAEAGMPLEIVEPLIVEGAYVSSSRVRDLVRAGQVAEVRDLLTRPYRIRGLVTHGDARGTRIGFPTANLDAIDTLLPAQGVYAGCGLTISGTRPAAINVGPNPTFGEHSLKVEVHLLDFHGSLYGTAVEVDFLARLRDIRPFGSLDELTTAAGAGRRRHACDSRRAEASRGASRGRGRRPRGLTRTVHHREHREHSAAFGRNQTFSSLPRRRPLWGTRRRGRGRRRTRFVAARQEINRSWYREIQPACGFASRIAVSSVSLFVPCVPCG